MESLFTKHKELLERAVKAVHERTFYTPYPEHFKAYPEQGLEEAKKWFQQIRESKFELPATLALSWAGEENSPFTQENLGIKYPFLPTELLVENADKARKDWKSIAVNSRAGFLVEILEQMKKLYFHLAVATEHTAGQSFMMAFQASGPHSADRALEAAALAWHELLRFPQETVWEKPMGKFSIQLNKEFKPIGRGIGLAIGCSTFPIWNSIPGIFANIMAGNPVIVKPHAKSVLPMALLIRLVRELAISVGSNPDIIQLAIDLEGTTRTEEFVNHKKVKLIDYTGNSTFGDRVEASGKITFTEKAGVNPVLIDSVENIEPVLQNLAFSTLLYSGQMCTSPQNFYLPEEGIQTANGIIAADEVIEQFKKALHSAVNHPKIGPDTLASIQNEATVQRATQQEGSSVELSSEIKEILGNRRFAVPTVNEIKATDARAQEELFGPIVNLIKVKNSHDGLQNMVNLIEQKGCITAAVYTTNAAFKEQVKSDLEDVGAGVSFNLTGYIWVNQAAAFSDFHVSSGNAAGNATFVNPEFVNKRFYWVGHRELRQ